MENNSLEEKVKIKKALASAVLAPLIGGAAGALSSYYFNQSLEYILAASEVGMAFGVIPAFDHLMEKSLEEDIYSESKMHLREHLNKTRKYKYVGGIIGAGLGSFFLNNAQSLVALMMIPSATSIGYLSGSMIRMITYEEKKK